jgi:hypothetical protein
MRDDAYYKQTPDDIINTWPKWDKSVPSTPIIRDNTKNYAIIALSLSMAMMLVIAIVKLGGGSSGEKGGGGGGLVVSSPEERFYTPRGYGSLSIG